PKPTVQASQQPISRLGSLHPNNSRPLRRRARTDLAPAFRSLSRHNLDAQARRPRNPALRTKVRRRETRSRESSSVPLDQGKLRGSSPEGERGRPRQGGSCMPTSGGVTELPTSPRAVAGQGYSLIFD